LLLFDVINTDRIRDLLWWFRQHWQANELDTDLEARLLAFLPQSISDQLRC